MNTWIVVFGALAIRYNGSVSPDISFEQYGINWIALRAISEIDAKVQADSYVLGKHPKQEELNRVARALRVLAAESEDKALVYFKREHPLPKEYCRVERTTFNLRLEAIDFEAGRRIQEIESFLGEEGFKPRRPWVAEIIGVHPKYKFNRSFLRYNISYEEAESQGDRGVYFFYELSNDKIYEVHDLVSRKRVDRYFCKVESGSLVKITEDEVVECLKSIGLA